MAHACMHQFINMPNVMLRMVLLSISETELIWKKALVVHLTRSPNMEVDSPSSVSTLT